MPRITQIDVEYGRTVSDGNYGSERVAVTLAGALDPSESELDAADQLLGLARMLVVDRLKASDLATVRRAVELEERWKAPAAPPPGAPLRDPERDRP